MKKLTFLFCMLLGLLACNNYSDNPHIIIETDLGNLILELYPEQAPITVKNFLDLIDKNEFEGATFYRAVTLDNQPQDDIKIEVIQGGLSFTRDLSQYELIEHETTEQTGILHTNGVISMARVEPGTACTEFFICIGDQPSLDFDGERNPDLQGFSAFGKVIEGFEVMLEIQALPEENQLLKPRLAIKSIKRFNH
ncbi:MAG: peptidylprolyl isomerase [Bacteroidetes bacterium]|nr:peptidylprolyl isomerase [Bacteroidota bacterium]